MSDLKVVNLVAERAMRTRPADFVFEVRFWRLSDARFWHEAYSLASSVGQPSPKDFRIIAHGLMDDANHVWDLGGSARPPKRKVVKRRRGRR